MADESISSYEAMQSTGARVIKNTGILIATELISRALGFGVLLVAARLLGAANFGVLAFAYSLSELLSIAVVFGLDTVVVRTIARDAESPSVVLGRLIVIQSVLALAVMLLIGMLLAQFEADGTKRAVILIVASGYVAYSFTMTFNAFFRAHQLMSYEATVRLVFGLLRTVLVMSALMLGHGLFGYVVSEWTAYVVGLVVSFVILSRRIAKPAFSAALKSHWHFVRDAAPFAAMSGLVTIYVGSDTVLLSLLTSDEMTGWYAAATKFFFLFSFLPKAVIAAVLPVMARQYGGHGPQDQLLETSRQTFRMLLIIGLPIAIGIAVLAEPIVLLVYGESFLPAAPVLRILMVALLLGFANWACDSTLIALNKERSLLRIVVVGVGFNIASNLLAIPFFGHIGAAMTTVASEGLVLLCKLFVISRVFEALPLGRNLVKPIVSGAILVVFLVIGRSLPVLLLIIPAAAVYIGSLLLLRAFSATELRLVWMLLPLRRQERLTGPGQ
ncbi:MAG: flippase [Chloroflexota bacterium]